MKKLRIFKLIILTILMIFFPITMLFSFSSFIPNQYDNTIYKELGIKYDLLNKNNKEKIVLIGGSSVSFGYDSALIERYTDYKVVNFGLYASLGTKVMMDLSEKYINEGDIVILMPELNKQTYSLYFNGLDFLQCVESKPSLALKIKNEDKVELIGNYPSYLSKKVDLYRKNAKPNPNNVYNVKNFNEYGDVDYDRPYNIMPSLYDQNNMVNISSDLLNKDFINYVNKYNKFISDKKATLFFSFSPINKLSLDAKTNFETIKDFYLDIIQAIDCRIISNINDCIMHENYFYDTNFHLNNFGVVAKTKALIEDLYRELNITKKVDIKVTSPEDINKEEEENENIQLTDKFEYKLNDKGAIIDAVKTEYINDIEITIPNNINGIKVLGINDNVLNKMPNLESVQISEGKFSISEHMFNECNKLKKIILLEDNPSNISFNINFLNDINNCYIYVSKSSYGNYLADYYWSTMSKYLKVNK